MAIDIKLLKKPEIMESVSSAVDREIEIGNFMIKKCEAEIKAFEGEFNLKREDFLSKFESGKLDDREEFFQWYAAIKAKERWAKKLRTLRGISK